MFIFKPSHLLFRAAIIHNKSPGIIFLFIHYFYKWAVIAQIAAFMGLKQFKGRLDKLYFGKYQNLDHNHGPFSVTFFKFELPISLKIEYTDFI